MTLFDHGTLVVSLPLAELVNVDLPASIMTPEQALSLPVSRTLACALALVESHCRRRGVSTTYVVRPEIFTHGLSVTWLKNRLGDIREHLCISDASAIKVIDGCHTHIFLYRLAYYDSYTSFFRMTRRVPDMLEKVSSQLNTGLAWETAGGRVQPPSLYLDAMDLPDAPPAAIYPFQFSPKSFGQNAQSISHARGPWEIDSITTTSVRYIPLTETGLQDAAFARSVARQVLKAFFNSEQLLLLRLPSERQGETLATRIAGVVQAIASAGVTLPRSAPPNIFFLSSDLAAPRTFMKLSIVLHESFEFWRYPRSFYELAESIRVESGAESAMSSTFLPLDVRPIYGSHASRVWLRPDGLPRLPEGTA